MTALGLPYISVPTLPVELPLIGPHTFTVFGVLAVVGIVLGHRCSMRLAHARGLDERQADRLVVAVAIGGFVGAHWVSILFYYPDRVVADPWVLLYVTSGLSSVGGFVGGALTFAWWCHRHRLDPRVFADVVAYGLLAGFTIGRLGCSLVRDHPGATASTDAWLAVGPWPDGTFRFDLGLLELLLLLPLCLYVYRLADWRHGAPGRLTITVAIAYAILRFPLDFLRAEDPRYGPLTPAQYACLGFVAIGVWWWRRRRR